MALGYGRNRGGGRRGVKYEYKRSRPSSRVACRLTTAEIEGLLGSCPLAQPNKELLPQGTALHTSHGMGLGTHSRIR